MKNLVSSFLLTTLSTTFVLCTCAAQTVTTPMIDSLLTEARHQFAPDKRTAVFDVRGTLQGNSLLLTGEVHNADLKKSLLQFLHEKTRYEIVDSLAVLPQASLGDKTSAVVSVSVANLRTKPDNGAELATQAILGTPLRVLKKMSGWYYFQTPDDYLGWSDDVITFMNKDEYDRWAQAPKIIVTAIYGFIHKTKEPESQVVSDVVIGSLLKLVNDAGDYYEVGYPDGRTGYLAKRDGEPLSSWLSRVQESETHIVAAAESFFGIPYLWGGTSAKAFDCSGFTKTVYFLNGVLLPRDANQQAGVGTPVDTSGDWTNVRPGDLLFFGSKAKPGKPERIVHVAISLGGKRFIHCSGDVRINSLNPAAPDYSDYRAQSFVRATRIIGAGTHAGVRHVSELPYFHNHEP